MSKEFPAIDRRQKPKLALRDICMDIEEQGFVTVVGPSGCGKSTLLSCIGGLETYSGRIEVTGRRVSGPPDDVAIVFQAPQLLPWLSVERNITFGLQARGVIPRNEWSAEVNRVLDLVKLADVRDRFPKQLSGGMQQRVNICRALAVSPRVLLMDEPFGSLDAITREQMQAELQSLAVDSAVTVVFITHDISEAIYLGDRVVMLSKSPGSIIDECEVMEPRPRPLEFKRSAEFQDMYGRVWDRLMAGTEKPERGVREKVDRSSTTVPSRSWEGWT